MASVADFQDVLEVCRGLRRNAGVVWFVLRQGMILVAIGSGVGVLIALGGSASLETLLFNVVSADITTIVVASFILTVAGAAGAIVPAIRAARVDPVRTLRQY